LDADPARPIVYASFGSFLSVRADVLARVVAALRDLPVRVALAVGSADRRLLGELPENWLLREFLPQVALLERAALAVSHGGNNSVTESLLFGVPMLVLPFSTDQFTGAAAIENAGLGRVLDPNAATADQLRLAGQALLQGETARRAADLGATLRDKPGRQLAFEAMTAHA
jgi:MGT family glycosyltransferase